MSKSFWHMVPCDAAFAEIKDYPMTQKNVFLPIIEGALYYNIENETSLTVGEYYNLVFPKGLTKAACEDDRRQWDSTD